MNIFVCKNSGKNKDLITIKSQKNRFYINIKLLITLIIV
jgi:hypothetical protein